jgi:ParB-like chromosome segregation protein Spo0J
MGKPAADALRSRIVGEGEEAPDQLLANPLNWRTHPKHQADALEGLLDEVGWVQRIIVNRRTGHVVDGHLRVQVAQRRGEPAVPVLYVDLSEEEERLVLASLDPIGAMAGTDRDMLSQVLASVEAPEGELQRMLASLAVDAGVIAPDFSAAGLEDQGKLDERTKHTCPACGHAF